MGIEIFLMRVTKLFAWICLKIKLKIRVRYTEIYVKKDSGTSNVQQLDCSLTASENVPCLGAIFVLVLLKFTRIIFILAG